jgi:hypothetical protein
MRRFIVLVLMVVAVSMWAAKARASSFGPGDGDPFTINFDENGNGTIDLGGGAVPNPGALLPDPSQVGNPLALTYFLGAGGPVVAGDLRVWEDFIGGTLGDVVRFTDATGSLTSLAADRLIFYSLAGGGDLADTGLPGNVGAGNFADIVENGSGAFQFVAAGPNVYNGVSDGSLAPASVPAPASAWAGLVLLTALAGWRITRVRIARAKLAV